MIAVVAASLSKKVLPVCLQSTSYSLAPFPAEIA